MREKGVISSSFYVGSRIKPQSLTRPRNKQAVVRKPDAEGSDATSHNERSVWVDGWHFRGWGSRQPLIWTVYFLTLYGLQCRSQAVPRDLAFSRSHCESLSHLGRAGALFQFSQNIRQGPQVGF